MSQNRQNTLLLLLKTIILRPAFAYLPAGEGKRLGALGALLLTQAVNWQKEEGEGAWFHRSLEDWRKETAMTEAEMDEARARLRKTDFWKEREASKPEPRLFVFVDMPALAEALERVTEEGI